MNERPTIAPDETSRFDARLRVLNSVEHHRPILKDLGSLHKEAAKALGKNHPVTVEIASAAAWVSAGHRSATDVVRLYERLIQAVEGREPTPTLRAPAALRTGYARALRRAGNQNALQEYRNLLAAKVADDPQSERRETGIARLNLAVALRSISGVPELMESLSLCEEEVARRTARHGADDRYTLMARAGRLGEVLACAGADFVHRCNALRRSSPRRKR